MGLKISTEQHAAVLRGEAVSTNRYIHYPHGVAAKCIWGGYANGPNGPYISSNRGTDWHLGKLDVPQAAVLEIMGRVGATELYEEFMAAVYALVDSGVVMTWRRDLLRNLPSVLTVTLTPHTSSLIVTLTLTLTSGCVKNTRHDSSHMVWMCGHAPAKLGVLGRAATLNTGCFL